MDQKNFIEPICITQNIELFLPLYQFDLSQEIDIEKTISKILIWQAESPTTTRTNVITTTGWRSAYVTPNDPKIDIFQDELAVIKEKLSLVNSFPTNLTSLWAVIYGKNDFTKMHNHFNLWDRSAYNTVLYLNDSETAISFPNINQSTIEIFPKKGMLIVMHPITYHAVLQKQDDADRIVLVCNFNM